MYHNERVEIPCQLGQQVTLDASGNGPFLAPLFYYQPFRDPHGALIAFDPVAVELPEPRKQAFRNAVRHGLTRKERDCIKQALLDGI